jgi:hypothetical protein
MGGKWAKNKDSGLMTGDGRGLGEVKKGPGWIAMERREEKSEKYRIAGIDKKRSRVWGLGLKEEERMEPLAKVPR